MREREELVAEWKQTAMSGSFMTPKHDPNGEPSSGYHTKLTPEVSSSIGTLLESGLFDVDEVQKAGHKNVCWMVTPHSGALPTEVATAFSGSVPVTGSVLDVLLVASGGIAPPHVMGESSVRVRSGGAYTVLRRLR